MEMIAELNNTFFIITAIFFYLIISASIAKWFNLFAYLGTIDFIKKIGSNKETSSIITSIKKSQLVTSNIAEKVLRVLERFSLTVSKTESAAAIFISKSSIELIMFISLFARRPVIATVNSAWSLILVIIVLLYLILTNC